MSDSAPATSETPPHGYEFLDCGSGRRLERFGALRLIRPAPAAAWTERHPAEWRAEGEFADGGWTFAAPPPETWAVDFGLFRLELSCAAGGQVGVFPEQADNWSWLAARAREAGRGAAVLNAFAHTGASSLAAALGGAAVCHLDASRTAVARARRNAELNGLGTLRWIADDALKFMAREVKRGRRYEGLILDPPAFGRGGGGKTWKLSRDLPKLLELARALLSDRASFLLLTCHAPDLAHADLRRDLAALGLDRRGRLSGGENLLRGPGNPLPAGRFVRWQREEA